MNETKNKAPDKKNITEKLTYQNTPYFWDLFSNSIWEKSTFSQKVDFISSPLSECELFNLVVEICNDYIAGRDSSTGVRFYVNGVEPKFKFAHLLPSSNDYRFFNYKERLRQELDGQSFVLIIDGLTMTPKLKSWTNNFLISVYRPIKKMNLGHFWSFFFGDYSSTPFGVHEHSDEKGSESAFYFPVKGKKEMRTWTPDYVKKNQDLMYSKEFEDHKDNSTLLSAEAGGMIYWPSDRWHVGSSRGGDVSMVLAIRARSDLYFDWLRAHKLGLFDEYIPYKRSSNVNKILITIIEGLCRVITYYRKKNNPHRDYSLPFNPDNLQASATDIPLELKTISKIFYFAYRKNLARVLTKFWLIHLATLGVASFERPKKEIELAQFLEIEKVKETIILWRQVDPSYILVVVGFYSCELPIRFIKLVKALAENTKTLRINIVDIKSLCAKLPSEEYDVELANFLKFLGTSGAFITPSS